MPRPACRLFVIPARDAPVAVVLRRGPSAWYHVILWDLVKDRFEHGAWLRGRIYEDRCDLSPDGALFLSFVMQGARSGTSYTHAWTAVSRPPWLHALTLWPQGTTYGGGGRFTEKRKAILRTNALRAHPRHPLVGLEVSSGNPPRLESSKLVEGAEWDGRGSDGYLLFAREGKLFRRVRTRDVELADFNGLEPAPVKAPEWATRRPRERGALRDRS